MTQTAQFIFNGPREGDSKVSHSAMLRSHSAMLRSHSARLRSHSARLRSHSAMQSTYPSQVYPWPLSVMFCTKARKYHISPDQISGAEHSLMVHNIPLYQRSGAQGSFHKLKHAGGHQQMARQTDGQNLMLYQTYYLSTAWSIN